MIWDIIEQSTFDKHFQNPNLTIEELLIDENILTQMQNLNPQLLQYVNNNLNDIINKLVIYVTVMPRQEQGYDRCHKLPYVSSQILAIDSQIFYQAFFNKNQAQPTKHFAHLLQFLNSDAINNQLLLGYFQKVINNLYKGRKLQFSKAVAANLPLFCNNLHTQTIGNLLKNCVILLGEKQGILYQQRKKIVMALVSNIVQPKNKSKQSQIRQVCSSALVEIIGRHKTFSSGDQLLNYVLNYCGELLIIYSQIQAPQICRFLIGLLTKSTQKIYDPQLDTKVNIFKIPVKHQKLLQGYLPLRLHVCMKYQNIAPTNYQKIRQQDGNSVIKVHRNVVDYLTLVAITLQNQIDQFLLNNNNYLNFAWQCMIRHQKNDILLVQINKIFLYVISERSKNKEKLRQNLINQFKIVEKICDIFNNSIQQKLLRPHLFQLWHQLIKWLPNEIKENNKNWKDVCQHYQTLIPLHTKTTGLNYNRPTNIKIVIDEEDAKATEENKEVLNNASAQQQNIQFASFRQQSFIPDKASQIKQFQRQQQIIKQQKEQQKISEDLAQFHAQITKSKQKQTEKSNMFNQFDFFFQKSKQVQANKNDGFADFSQFG